MMLPHPEFALRESTYQWSVRLFGLLRKVLSVNLKLHDPEGHVEDGDIFLFNHFARFETFIPQYMMYLEAGVYCRSVAAPEFFRGDDAFSEYLRALGVVPNDMPDLLPFLAAEVLRGRRVVIFPEGGMVKDRRVLDGHGGYEVYSRTAERRRKHHAGAAVLALALEAIRCALRVAHERGDSSRIEQWAAALDVEPTVLIGRARRPTRVVPANITFYPIRVADNLLRRGAELMSRGLSRRHTEELLIEGNILLRDTDMDIRLGTPVDAASCWRWWDAALLKRVASRLDPPESIFALRPDTGRWDARLLARAMRRGTLRMRDDYMRRMYAGVTVNLSHLASVLIIGRVRRGEALFALDEVRRTLYLAVKRIQRDRDVHLHRGLRNPETYGGLCDGVCEGLDQLLATASGMGLIECDEQSCTLDAKLLEDRGFDSVRIENLVEVYANEAAPIAAVATAIADSERRAAKITPTDLARLRFDDERISHVWDRHRFRRARYAEINDSETATANGAPFLLLPEGEARAPAVVLVHGFLASPAEMRGLGDRLHKRGHPVVGVRLKGHGTSPCDLRERGWKDWAASVRRGYMIAAAFAPRVCLVGFSTGGALALLMAAERPAGLAGVAAASVPVKFQDPGMMLVPLVHHANRLARRLPWGDGLVPYQVNESEHPDINYRHIPVRGLYELRLMVEALEERLARVDCPVELYQGDEDPVVVPESAALIARRLDPRRVAVRTVASKRHGIVYEDIGGVPAMIEAFVAGC